MRWSGIATVFSMLACYGTLTAVSVLAAFGLTLPVNGTVWASAIIAFAALAILALILSYMKHTQRLPLLPGLVGFAALIYALLINYHWFTELAGFAGLVSGAWLDRKARRTIAS